MSFPFIYQCKQRCGPYSGDNLSCNAGEFVSSIRYVAGCKRKSLILKARKPLGERCMKIQMLWQRHSWQGPAAMYSRVAFPQTWSRPCSKHCEDEALFLNKSIG
jgi:hypothetical protein